VLLVGDLGGTKTNLAIVSRAAGPRQFLVEASFPSGGYPSLEALVREFLVQVTYTVDRACFGVAGPVVGGHATITNLPWVIDERQLQASLGLYAVRLLNDLTAIAHAVPFLMPAELHTLNTGQPLPGGTLAVIAPGTGLGEAYLTWDGSRYRAHPSEGGHASFAPVSLDEIELLRYLFARFGHISVERVCSGIGLPNIYAYMRDSGSYGPEPAWLADRLAAAPDPTPVIAGAALDEDRPCELCNAALRMFVSILGAEAGDLALKVLATGGVYLGGGIPPRILSVLVDRYFIESFRGKGRLAELMDRIPVHVILNPKAALLGVAYHGVEVLSD
jgi:glucokinase